MFKKNKYIKLILLHILIGIALYIYNPIAKLYYIAYLVFFLHKILTAPGNRKFVYVITTCGYIIGSEVFLRMTQGNFLYESSKYLVILFIILGMIFTGIKNKSYPYFIFLLLLIPSMFIAGAYANPDVNLKNAIAFNLSGPVCLGFVALYTYGKKISFSDLQNVMLAALLPVISTAVYLFLYTPNLRDVLTGTQSNFQTSGGFGPNQVATVLGLGMFIIATRYFLNSKMLLSKIINLLILAVIAYRGIVTFSRGGIFAGIIIIIAFLGIYYLKSREAERNKILKSLYLFLGIAALTWITSSVQTMGLIDKRYTNQDAAGRIKKDITTGRSNIILFEMSEFIENPFFGIGVGKVREFRLEKEGINAASHNEMTRIVAEHGMFGIIAFLILLFVPLAFRAKNKNNVFFFSFYLFWFLTINHSSMRIAAPAFIYGLSLLNVQYDKRPIHRKQVKLKQR